MQRFRSSTSSPGARGCSICRPILPISIPSNQCGARSSKSSAVMPRGRKPSYSWLPRRRSKPSPSPTAGASFLAPNALHHLWKRSKRPDDRRDGPTYRLAERFRCQGRRRSSGRVWKLRIDNQDAVQMIRHNNLCIDSHPRKMLGNLDPAFSYGLSKTSENRFVLFDAAKETAPPVCAYRHKIISRA